MNLDEMSLDQIGLVHGTDQASSHHGFLSHMESFLEPMRETASKVVEIGVAGAAGTRTLRDYFSNAHIFGIDHNPESCKFDLGPRVTLIHGDASHEEFWKQFENENGGNLDLISDDASHNVWATWVAFHQGWKLLKPSGLFLIQDIHAGWDPAYRRDNEPNGLPKYMTVHDWICDLAITRLHEGGANQCGKPTTADFESIYLSKSLAVIKKR